MKVGLDTGFLLKLYAREKNTLDLWERFLGKDVDVVTCLLCGYEFLKVLASRGIPLSRLISFWRDFSEGVEVVGVTEELIQDGVRLEIRYRLGAMDSLILAAFLEAGCKEVFTTDERWKERVREARVRVLL